MRIAQEKKLAKEITKKLYKPHIDFSGHKYGKLTILYWCGVRINKRGNKRSLWYCSCECGNIAIKTSTAFKIPNISCGCVYKVNRVRRAIKLSKKWQYKRNKMLSDSGFIEDTIKHKSRRATKTIRNRAFSKYGEKCLICGKPESKKDPLCIHHLRPHWGFPRLRHMVINNIPLCRNCHDALHKIFGTINPSPIKQWEYIYKQRHLNEENDNYLAVG
jgi:hypothetical protein